MWIRLVDSHLENTKVCFQAMPNQNRVSTDKAQQSLLHLTECVAVLLHIVLTDSWKPTQ